MVECLSAASFRPRHKSSCILEVRRYWVPFFGSFFGHAKNERPAASIKPLIKVETYKSLNSNFHGNDNIFIITALKETQAESLQHPQHLNPEQTHQQSPQPNEQLVSQPQYEIIAQVTTP